MKSILFQLLVIAGLLAALPLFSQSDKTLREQQKYVTSYEKSTLSENELPILMPYNKWVDPAGEQLHFGDNGDENHALDCSLSPDGKWIAVEGRYSVVIIDPVAKKIINRSALRSPFVKESLMNTYSGISWLKTGDTYQLFWSSVGKANKSCVVQASWDGNKMAIVKTFPFEAVKPAETALGVFAKKDADHLVRTEVPASSFGHSYREGFGACNTFRTRRNSVGVYQFEGVDNSTRRGVGLRYKLLRKPG